MRMLSTHRKTNAAHLRVRNWIVSIAATLSVIFASSALAAQTAEQSFRNFEALLARAGRFDVKAHVVSSGAIDSDLNADVGVANAGIVVIRVKGTLQGKPDEVVFRTDGIVTMVGKDGQQTRLQPGKSMRQAVQVGFARLGLWHNLLLLSHGAQPEHNTGGILEWVTVANIHYASPTKKGLTGLAFDVSIEGDRVGQATLWLDETTKMPVRREQSISIDGKTVNTVEEYSNFIPTA
jgi:hypothetical protein